MSARPFRTFHLSSDHPSYDAAKVPSTLNLAERQRYPKTHHSSTKDRACSACDERR
jgi:hypothetical protein